MSDLGELVRMSQHQARSMSTELLIIAMTTQAVSLGEMLADFETARIARDRGEPDGELLYGAAFAAVIGAVVTMAAFTAELVTTRIEGWEFPAGVSPADIGLS